MIVADTPEYKALRVKLQSLDGRICEITMQLDKYDMEFHKSGISTPRSVLSELRFERSTAQHDHRMLRVDMENMKEAFRIKKQTDLLDELIALCRSSGNGHLVGMAVKRVEEVVFEDVEEGAPA